MKAVTAESDEPAAIDGFAFRDLALRQHAAGVYRPAWIADAVCGKRKIVAELDAAPAGAAAGRVERTLIVNEARTHPGQICARHPVAADVCLAIARAAAGTPLGLARMRSPGQFFAHKLVFSRLGRLEQAVEVMQ